MNYTNTTADVVVAFPNAEKHQIASTPGRAIAPF